MARALKRSAPTKEGPPVVASRRPSDRASLPDWEESVPNPALSLLSKAWLNEALMARERSAFDAIRHSARLQRVVEWQPARDSLGADPERSRGQLADIAMAEARGAAAIVDADRGCRLVQYLHRAVAPAMLEPREHRDVADTL